jgi:hypothetical protein
MEEELWDPRKRGKYSTKAKGIINTREKQCSPLQGTKNRSTRKDKDKEFPEANCYKSP